MPWELTFPSLPRPNDAEPRKEEKQEFRDCHSLLGPQRGVIQTRAFRAVAYLEAFGCLGGLSLKENAEHWSLSFCSPDTLGAVFPFRDTQSEVPLRPKAVSLQVTGLDQIT